MKSIEMIDEDVAHVEPNRMEDRGPLLIAGLRGWISSAADMQLASQWQRFAPHLGKVPGQIGAAAYGVCLGCGGADTFEYLCGVEVRDGSRIPSGWTRLLIPPQHYAVFAHRGPVSNLRETFRSVFERWLPESGHQLAFTGADLPDAFERYGAGFDPHTGTGDIEVWVPVGRKPPEHDDLMPKRTLRSR